MSKECNECGNPCGHNLGCPIWHKETLDENDNLKAENERMREALHKIAYDAYTKEDESLTSSQPTMIWNLVAQRALEPPASGGQLSAQQRNSPPEQT